MSAMDSPDFATLLRRYRRRGHLTQEELAAQAGISPGAVSLMERGLTHVPQKATMQLLCAALALTPDEVAALVAAMRNPDPPDSSDQVHPGDCAATCAVAPPFASDADVPEPLTALIGRERDVAAVLRLIDQPTTRLLTLSGPAGVGKTRLALHVAATLRREWGQEVVFVDLIPVQESERVLPAIAQTFGVRDSGLLPLRDSLIHALRDRQLVLLLDNFEQVLPAARAVLELLVACPRVKALVTSRSALNVRGEHCYPLSPLALPEQAQMESLDELCHVPTVALFLARASAGQPDFSIGTLEMGHLVTAICARLDGLPLAIELAAARVRHVGLRELHDRLAQPAFLGVLAGGPRDLADHQRTMRSAIAWSYTLLSNEEQRLFRRLGVFVGGASVDAIETVAGCKDDALLSSLAALVDANLVQCVDPGDTLRYTQLVTLRAYAQEQLRVEGEWEDAHRKHADYFLALTDQMHPEQVEQPAGTFERVEAEYENVRAALAWALESGAVIMGLRMVGHLWRYWGPYNRYLEGLDWSERFIAQAEATETGEQLPALAEAWTAVLVMSFRLNRFARACEAGEIVLALRRRIGDKPRIAHAMMSLANVLTALRDFGSAATLYQECLALLRATNQRRSMVFPLMNLGELYLDMAKPQEALTSYEESLALSEEVGESDWARWFTWCDVGEVYIILDEPSRAVEIIEPNAQLVAHKHDLYAVATCAFTLGRAHWRLGNAEAAQNELDEAARLFRTLGNPILAARVLYYGGSLALDQGDMPTAQRYLAQALEDLMRYAPESEYFWWLVERTGTLACRRGESELAACLQGAALAHRETTTRPIDPAERELRARDLEQLRGALGESAFADGMADGQALSFDGAVTLVQQVLRQHDG